MLLWTMAEGQYHMMFAWLDRNPDKVGDSLENAIWTAVTQEWTGAIEALAYVRKVPIATIRGASGGSLLHLAAAEKAYRSLETLLRLKVDPNQQTTHERDTALHESLKRSRLRVATSLAKVTDPNLVNRHNETVLHWALKNRLGSVATRNLIKRFTDWTRQDDAQGDTVLLCALRDHPDPKLLMPMMARGASVALHIPNHKGQTAQKLLQVNARAAHRHHASAGLALYEQQVLRATLQAAEADPDEPSIAPPPVARARRRM